MANDELLIVDMIGRIEEAIDNSPIPRMGSADRRLVNADVIFDMLVELKTSLPENIRRANSVLLEAGKIIEDAEDHASALVSDAETRTNEMTQNAEERATTTIADADAYYNEKIASADDYFEHRTAEALENAERIIDEAQKTREQLISESEITLEATKRAEELRKRTVIRSNQVYTNAKKSADSVFAELMGYLEEYYAAIEADRKALDLRPPATERKAQPASNQTAQNHGQNNGRVVLDTDSDEDDGDDEDEGNTSLFSFFKKRKKRGTRHDEGGEYEDIDE